MKQKMAFLDLDYTLSVFTIPFWTIGYQMHGITEYRAPTKWGVGEFPVPVQNTCKALFRCKWYMIDMMEFKSTVLQFLGILRHVGFTKIIILTQRDMSLWFETRKKIMECTDGIDEIVFVDTQEEKEVYFNPGTMKLWVDDNPNNCIKTAKMGIPTYMMAQPWNMDVDIKTYAGRCFNTLHKSYTLMDVAQHLLEEKNG